MKRLLLSLGLVLFTGLASAQVLPQPGPPTPQACAYNTTPVTLTDGQAGWVQCDNAGNQKVSGAITLSSTTLSSQYPTGAVPYTATATGTTGATAATLTGAASVTTYICGFSIRANATAAANGNAVVSGTITGSLNYTQYTAAVAAGVGVVEQTYSPCIPASAANTSIAVTSAAPGTGGVVSVSAWGFKL